jgi:flagellar motor switch protein FliM
MSDILSEDEIAALFEAAKDGQAPPEPETRKQRRPRRVREIDFSRPTKFTQDQQRRIERAHATFCRQISTQLSAELRTTFEFEVINIAQHSWAAALDEIPQPSVYAILQVAPLGTTMVLSIELAAIHRILTRMLGGSDPGRVPERQLTEIELTLARRVLGTVLQGLSATWHDLLGVELSLGALETTPQGVQLAPPSEPSLAITIEAVDSRASSTVSIVVPHRAIEQVLDRIPSGQQYGDASEADHDPRDAEALRTSVAAVEVEVRAEVAAVELTLEEVVALAPGDIVTLPSSAEAGVTLFADETPIQRCRPGRSGSRRAVQVVERLEGNL